VACAGIGRFHDAATCTDRGKHPCGRWSAETTTAPQRIVAFFTGYPRNIAVACGPSGLLVVDVDKPGDFARYAATVGATVPETSTIATARGSHYYFQAGDPDLGNAEGALDYGVSIRGKGANVVAPGSLHTTGAIHTGAVDVLPAPWPRRPRWTSPATSGAPRLGHRILRGDGS